MSSCDGGFAREREQLNRMAEKLEFPRKAKCAECGLEVEDHEGRWVSRTKFVCDGCREKAE